MSVLTAVLLIIGFVLTFSGNVESKDLAVLIFRASIPLPTLSGFYMVYLNFVTQKNQNEKDTDQSQVELRLQYHLRNVSNFRMRDPKSDMNQSYMGQSAMEFFIRTFDQYYFKLENKWLFLCMGALKRNQHFDEDLEFTELYDLILESQELDRSQMDKIWQLCEDNLGVIHETLFEHIGHHNSLRHFFIELSTRSRRARFK